MVQQTRIVVSALEGFIQDAVKAVISHVLANLVASPPEGGTPVDTGWARANWIPSSGQPFPLTVGSREAVSAGRQQLGLAQVLTSYTLTQGPAHVTNNVPYIGKLNAGSSRQAPAGFVQAGIAKAVTRDLPLTLRSRRR